MVLELFIVVVLTLLNGFFSMSEIALVTVRKTRIASLVKEGHSAAKIVQKLQHNPESLFATVQVGMSVITITASTFAGSSIASDLAVVLDRSKVSFLAEYSYSISLVFVVAALSYISITIGELIPKSLGLRYSERMALVAAYPIWLVSRFTAWPIRLLMISTNLFLRLFKDSTTFIESRLSEEEIRSLISEGRKAGTVEVHEDNIIQNVFDFSDLRADKIMIPRTQMSAVDINFPVKEVIMKAIESGYSRIPVYENDLNNIVGILYTKKLLANFGQDSENLKLQDFLVPAYFVPGNMKISEVLQRLQKKKAHMALITDEHGEIEGLVTLEDVLEEIVGDISDETDEADYGIKQADGGFVVAGSVSIVDFNKYFKTDLPENEDYSTVSGYIISHLGQFPTKGDSVDYKDFHFIVKQTTHRTVKSVVVKQVSQNL